MTNTIGDSSFASGLLPAIQALTNDNLSGASSAAAGAVTAPSSLSSDLSLDLSEAASSVNQFTLAFDDAMQTATSVDPTTGQSEMQSAAASQLAAALGTLLVNNGFSASQASAASSSFEQQLTEGGQINLNTSFNDATAISASSSSSNGWQTTSISAVGLNERSGSVSIELDPDTGQLSLSLNEQQLSYTSVDEVMTTGFEVPNATPLLWLLPTGDGTGSSTSGAASTGSADAQADAGQQASNASADDIENDAASEAAQTASTDEHDILNQLMKKATAETPTSSSTSTNGTSGTSNTSDPTATGSATTDTNAAAATQTAPATPAANATTVVGFTQPLSVQVRNADGHGTTLYRRPDGTTGAISFTPLRTEA